MAKFDILEDGYGVFIEDEDGKLIQIPKDEANVYFVDAFIDPQSVLTGGKYLISAKLEDKTTVTVLEDGDSNAIEDGDGALIEIPELIAVAIYSADDNSFTFYGVTEIPEVGSQFCGKTVTNVYQDIDTVLFKRYVDVSWYRIRSRITSVSFDESFRHIHPISLSYWFYGFENCEKIDLKHLDTSEVTLMSSVFVGCTKITDLDLSGFDTSKVTNMTSMFENDVGLTDIDLSSFDTSNVTEMDTMFCGCTGITTLDISDFKTPNLISMGAMFANMTNIKTIYSDDDNFTVENVTYASGREVFEECYSLVGGAGMEFNEEMVDYYMAHVDTLMNRGYFTAKQ